jgi:Holliday junction resolvase-like predicted endonuclease
MRNEWFWEGNIVENISNKLQSEGWKIEFIADTYSKASGIDIKASKNKQILIVEVKGYPSKYYQSGENIGKLKRTNPSTQARHWFGEVLLTSLLRKNEFPNALQAIGLPKFSVYEELYKRTKLFLNKLEINIIWVYEKGEVITSL